MMRDDKALVDLHFPKYVSAAEQEIYTKDDQMI